MANHKKPTGRTISMPGALALGGLCSMLIILLGSMVLAKLIDADTIPVSSMGYGIMIILILAAYIGAVLAYQKVRRQRLLVCMANGLIIFALLLSITALFFGGQYSAVGETALLILCGSGLAVLTGKGRGRGEKRKNKAHRL